MRFEYAVFLLNKDVEQLMNATGLSVKNLRHTLGNILSIIHHLERQSKITSADCNQTVNWTLLNLPQTSVRDTATSYSTSSFY